ncbi:hypothetical protein BD779DRAFT_1685139 [Infundibulicybe gibba]|nr:hypothetical protein BD779DRAFT_1685139 [Infundibulicybe gibba]
MRFIKSADGLFGLITTLRNECPVIKQIPWLAFELSESDWATVLDTWMILEDSHRVLHHFSKDKRPSLMGEETGDVHFAKYFNGLNDALAKIKKYYTKFDDKPVYVLSLTSNISRLHGAAPRNRPKLEEKEAGNKYAKNWQDEAYQILEKTMTDYHSRRSHEPLLTPGSLVKPNTTASKPISTHASDVDGGWAEEMRRYLRAPHADVTKETDLVAWCLPNPRTNCIGHLTMPSILSAMLGAELFEQLQVMKSAWRGSIVDFANLNSMEIEDIIIEMFGEFLELEVDTKEWDL